MITIRQAIRIFTESKAARLKRDFFDVLYNSSLCIVIPLNNGVSIFIDSHPEMEYFKSNYPLEMPNKNGVFKRISFEILDNPNNGVVIPNSIDKYISKSSFRGVLYHVDAAKESVVNEFISANGGININELVDNIRWSYGVVINN